MSDPQTRTTLFPPIEPRLHGLLPVDGRHTLYWEECGNPDGLPVLFLHGGPGAGLSPQHRCFFDPEYYRIILFDQRGAGNSTPSGEFRDNTTQLLVQDIEQLRGMFGIDQWLVFGGSWGSTLALAYGQSHPERCLGFVLRGIFLCTKPEVDWFMGGVRSFFPELHDEFVNHIPPEERGDLMAAYTRRLLSDDPALSLPAARVWSRFEAHRVTLLPPKPSASGRGSDEMDLCVGRLEAHYMSNGAFLEEGQLLRDVGKIRHLPCVIVHGRYDVVCPPLAAYQLQQAWPEAKLHMVPDSGHSAFEPGTAAALVAATEQFKRKRGFD